MAEIVDRIHDTKKDRSEEPLSREVGQLVSRSGVHVLKRQNIELIIKQCILNCYLSNAFEY
jgi:hypothetical protein